MNNSQVKQGYNKAADHYNAKRDQFKNDKYLKKLNSLLTKNSRILDIGCGAGKPVDKFFIQNGHSIIGIDISEKMIELAQKNVPQGKFEVRDMSDLKLGEYKVDAIVSFYAIFHIQKENHQHLFEIINSFLPKDGLILVTMGAGEWEGEEDNFHGAKMFWSHFGAGKNRKIIEDAGFTILLDEIDTAGGEKHQVIIAKKSE